MSGKQPETVPPPPPFKPARPPNSAQIIGSLFPTDAAVLGGVVGVGHFNSGSLAPASQTAGPGGYPPPPPPHSPPPPKPKTGCLHSQNSFHDEELWLSNLKGGHSTTIMLILVTHLWPTPPRPHPDPIPPPPRPPRVELIKEFGMLDVMDILSFKAVKLAGGIQSRGAHYGML
ncbi:hypothetical protein RhiXN_03031 [Rhizoctonia solani]|uniref:Uncharacterized protein n=1 Tax=Rhizoctonia solani TaxID=456999 RepID=A0A8H8NTU4_9AGAM|nr:uncharacterized protein RhiXN_03031 [Rhizoctonia solani]QRW18107.1 hypothetical protein RhiXN_03031 [Rhizoctonia solani]